jgi:hypothetical protein
MVEVSIPTTCNPHRIWLEDSKWSLYITESERLANRIQFRQAKGFVGREGVSPEERLKVHILPRIKVTPH